MSMVGRTGLAFAALVVGLNAAGAAEATRLGTYKNWTAWTSTDDNGKICYISANPQDKQPPTLDHGDIFFFVIDREKAPVFSADGKTVTGYQPMRGEVQAQMGYAIKLDGNLFADIDGKSYKMRAADQTMWLYAAADEAGFVEAMKAGTQLVVKSTSARGNDTTYTYSLSGVTAAMAEIAKACP
ncbi:MAG: hypothetical protein KKH72_11835 [Alphaproteobacteria bacterium]|nr:hypothetical protein [Alphaproteobacteria bacterium]